MVHAGCDNTAGLDGGVEATPPPSFVGGRWVQRSMMSTMSMWPCASYTRRMTTLPPMMVQRSRGDLPSTRAPGSSKGGLSAMSASPFRMRHRSSNSLSVAQPVEAAVGVRYSPGHQLLVVETDRLAGGSALCKFAQLGGVERGGGVVLAG